MKNLPFDVLNRILEYDGRIRYVHRDGIYVNIINKYDYRYNIIRPKMNAKYGLIKQLNIGNNGVKFCVEIYYKNDEMYKGLIMTKKML